MVHGLSISGLQTYYCSELLIEEFQLWIQSIKLQEMHDVMCIENYLFTHCFQFVIASGAREYLTSVNSSQEEKDH